MSANKDARGYLYLVSYSQVGPFKNFDHWALYVALTAEGTDDAGFIHHSNYSSNPTVSKALQQVGVGCNTCTTLPGSKEPYRYGYISEQKTRTYRNVRKAKLVSAERCISSRQLDAVCKSVHNLIGYNLINHNCQDFVSIVLQVLVKKGYITWAEYSNAFRHQKGKSPTPRQEADQV